MDSDQIVSRMNAYLHISTTLLAEWLGELLPKTSDAWWSECVLEKLSFNQRETAKSKGFTKLEDFDLAALLRIADKSWYAMRNGFPQTHIAEIRELMALQEAADDYKESSGVKVRHETEEDDPDAEEIFAGTDVYKDYIGKRVFHTKQKMYGIVRTCDGHYLGIEFESGPKKGQVSNYSLEMCLSNGLLTIV